MTKKPSTDKCLRLSTSSAEAVKKIKGLGVNKAKRNSSETAPSTDVFAVEASRVEKNKRGQTDVSDYFAREGSPSQVQRTSSVQPRNISNESRISSLGRILTQGQTHLAYGFKLSFIDPITSCRFMNLFSKKKSEGRPYISPLLK